MQGVLEVCVACLYHRSYDRKLTYEVMNRNLPSTIHAYVQKTLVEASKSYITRYVTLTHYVIESPQKK